MAPPSRILSASVFNQRWIDRCCKKKQKNRHNIVNKMSRWNANFDYGVLPFDPKAGVSCGDETTEHRGLCCLRTQQMCFCTTWLLSFSLDANLSTHPAVSITNLGLHIEMYTYTHIHVIRMVLCPKELLECRTVSTAVATIWFVFTSK